MAITEKETLASLKLLVTVAKADGTFSPEERAVFDESLKPVTLPAGTTAASLLDGAWDAGALAAEITSQEARDAAFSSCFAMAHADRVYHPAEQAILEKLEKAWTVSKERKGLLGRLFEETKDTVSLTRIAPIADPARRQKEIQEDVLKYSVLSGVLGLNFIPFVSLATDYAVVGVQAKMFRDIGQYWGRETTKDTVKQVIAGVGVGTGARLAVNQLVRIALPGAGTLIAASTNFATTWALGKVANQYWESGGKADMKMLKDLFRKSQAEGKQEYEKHKADVEAKSARDKATLDRLAADYKAGKISQADYERTIAELK